MTLEDYMRLPYTAVVRPDEDGDYIARVKELKGCVAHGATQAEALQALDQMKRLWIEACLSDGDQVPLPEDETALPSGKWLQRVPRTLHAELISCASSEGVSLNQLIVTILARYTGSQCVPKAGIIRVVRGAAHKHINQGVNPWGKGLALQWVLEGAAHSASPDGGDYLKILSKIAQRKTYQVPVLEEGERGEAKHKGWN